MSWPFITEDYGEDVYEGLSLKDLKIDEAYVKFSSNHDSNLSVYHKSSFCFGCPYQKAFSLPAGENLTQKYSTNPYWSFIFSLSNEEFLKKPSSEDICSKQKLNIGEFGIYELNVNPSYCDFSVNKEPVFIYGALIVAVLFYFVFGVVCKTFKLTRNCLKKKNNPNSEMSNGHVVINHLPKDANKTSTSNQQPEQPQKKPRLQSLDTFRGITIVLMIFVNYGGGSYWFFEHTPWNGLHFADFVFPWFMWIMGVCIPMGIKSQLRRKTKKSKIVFRIIKRSLKLFAIGIIINTLGGYNELLSIRIPGVLQRFAIAYLVTSLLYLLCAAPFAQNTFEGVFSSIADIIILFPQWVIYILLVIGHTVFIFYMPVEGCPRGYLGPGGIVLQQNGQPSPDCIGGVTRMVDIWILGNNHIYQNPTAKAIYETSSFDPEGILGSATTVFQVFLGIQAGQILLIYSDAKSILKRWSIWSIVTLICSLALSSGVLIGGPIPVNKNLWSLSFVLITSSAAFLLLTICYILVDYKRIWKGSPFYQTGMNSIFLYIGHEVTYNVFPWRYKYGNMNTHFAQLTEDLIATSLWILIAMYMFKTKTFFTI
ncbi:UNVERIFIED_CONTAM: hypothetical protein RMT77_003483 [Armadillidium vulgare]